MANIASEVKSEILDKVKKGEPVRSLAEKYGISDRTIYAWLRWQVAGDKVSVLEFGKLKKENLILKEIVGALTIEVERLKKRSSKSSICQEIVALIKRRLQEKLINPGRISLTGLLGISKSSYFYRQRLPSRDEALKDLILNVLDKHKSYGHRRIALELSQNKKRVRRVMKLYGIKPYKRKARWRKRRDDRRAEQPYGNEIKGKSPTKPNLIWASDFTYLKFRNSYLYLATLMDLFTREIVGWSLSTKHTKDLIINAFFDGFKTTGKRPDIIHSDQGVEYCSREYQKLMNYLGITISMSRKSSPWENGYQESFFNNFKTDLGLEFDRFHGIGELVEAIHYQINYYNNERIQLTLKMPPAKFKQLYYQNQLHN